MKVARTGVEIFFGWITKINVFESALASGEFIVFGHTTTLGRTVPTGRNVFAFA